jgi:non-specific serine/threonine protein kinase
MQVLRSAKIRADTVGNHARAEALNREWLALAEEVGDEGELLKAMNSAAMITLAKGDPDEGRAQLIAVRERARAAGDRSVVAFTTVNLGEAANRGGDYVGALNEAGTAMELFQQAGDDGGVAVALAISGWAALGLPDPVRAEGFFREMLTKCGRVGWTRGTASAALGLGIALIALQRADRGIPLLSAGSSLLAELGSSVEDTLDHEAAWERYEQATTAARTALGESAFAAAWDRGAAMTLEDILTFAGTEQRPLATPPA